MQPQDNLMTEQKSDKGFDGEKHMRSIADLCETSVAALHHFAAEYSIGGKLDAHWKAVMPELERFLANQILLILQREHIDNAAQEIAWVMAQGIPWPDVSQVKEATRVIHAWGRWGVWKVVTAQEFRDEVILLSPPKKIPFDPERFIRALADQWRQLQLAGYYFDQVIQRIEGNDLKKHTYGVLLGRSDALQWLQNLSHKNAEGSMPEGSDWESAGRNAFVAWWEKDLPQLHDDPFHIQIQKLGITGTALKKNIVDEYRKAIKQPEHVSFDAMEEAQNQEGAPPALKIPLPSVSPQAPVRPLTNWQIQQLEEILGKTGRKIFVYVYQHADLMGEDGKLIHGAKKEIAGKLGCAQSTVGEYWGVNGKIQRNAKKINEIL